MSLVIVASTNPVKIDCTRSAFAKMFPGQVFEFQGVSVPSDVPAQPIGDTETLQGALNRARNARRAAPQGDYWVGIEGGIADLDQEMSAFAWVAVLSAAGCGKARSGAFYLPPALAGLVRQGVELGEADDRFFQRSNSKQANGAVGILTADALDRVAFYEPAVIMALIPFKNPNLYLPEAGAL